MKNNKWQALSMRDRAFLIREAVRNGITDINSIRDTWEHRFDGESNQPTEDEYIAQRAKERIQQAQDKAYNRTETVIPVFGKKTEADRIRQAEELEKARGLYNMYKTFKQKIDRGELIGVDFGFGYLDKKQINKVLSEAEAKLMHATYMHDADKLIGPGCVATSMDNYGKDCISNQQFAENPEKYGFVKIGNKEIKPGDIVQFDRKHMLMSNTQSTNNQGELTNPLNMRYSGSNGYDAVRKGSRYPADWKDIEAYRFVGDKADSLQWKKEYREKYGHQFSGKDNTKIQTDTEHKTDNSLIERIALNIGSKKRAKDEGRASARDIITGTIDALTGKEPTNNTNLAAFLGKPEDYGFEEINDNRGPQFHKRISQYEDQDIKTYKGVINPFNEYVVAQEDYDKFLELAKTGDLFYGNADGDNTHSLYSIQDGRHYTIESSPLHSGYRDDVQNYPIQFYIKEGKLYANAADFYDFNTDSWQGKMLTKKGKPYILRQNDIPVRSIYVPEDLLNLNPIYNVEEGLTDDIRRARNMHITVQNRENNK